LSFSVFGLFEFEDCVIDEESYDAGGDDAGRSPEDSDEGCNFVEFAYDLVLLLFFIRVGAVEEELVLFVTCDLTAVGEEQEEADGDDSPYDKHHGNSTERVHRWYLFLS